MIEILITINFDTDKLNLLAEFKSEQIKVYPFTFEASKNIIGLYEITLMCYNEAIM